MPDDHKPPFVSIAFLDETRKKMHEKMGGPPPYDFVFRGLWMIEPGPLLENGIVIGLSGDGETCAMDHTAYIDNPRFGTDEQKALFEDGEVEFLRSYGVL